MRRSLIACLFSLFLVTFGLGCLKMQSSMMVHPNGSVSGTVTVGIQEAFFNMSDDVDLSFGNMTLIDTENATVWSEDGWVYIQEEETFVDEENLTVQVIEYSDYTEYIIDADLSEFQDEAAQEDEYNLSDPFTQIFLQQMVFEFSVEMPGNIVEANTPDYQGSTATWSYNGVSILEADRLYIKSRAPIPEGLFLSLLCLVGLVFRTRLEQAD